MFQVRNNDGVIWNVDTLEKAFSLASKEKAWKISFTIGTERVRLIRIDFGWVYEDVFGDRGLRDNDEKIV